VAMTKSGNLRFWRVCQSKAVVLKDLRGKMSEDWRIEAMVALFEKRKYLSDENLLKG
jgi:hypothetical protein